MFRLVLLVVSLSYHLFLGHSIELKHGSGLDPMGQPTTPLPTTDQGSGADPWG